MEPKPSLGLALVIERWSQRRGWGTKPSPALALVSGRWSLRRGVGPKPNPGLALASEWWSMVHRCVQEVWLSTLAGFKHL